MYRVDPNGVVPVMAQVDSALRSQDRDEGLKRIPCAGGPPIRRPPRDKSTPRRTR